MAREFGNIKCRIWGEEDWRALTGPAQNLYTKLLTQSGLSFCGVDDYHPKRLAVLTAGETAETIDAAANELEAAGFIVVDRDTDEVLIRSFVRHDGILDKPNIAVAMAKNYHGIVSLRLRRAFIREIIRLSEDDEFRGAKAWGAPKVRELLNEPSTDPQPTPLAKGYPKGSDEGCPTTTTATTTSTATEQPLPQASAVSDRADVDRLCNLLADRIEDNGSRRPRITDRWRDSARLLLDRDGHREDQVSWLIEWCQRDEFWRANILSMPKFREKFDQLRLQATSGRGSQLAIAGSTHTTSTTDQRVAAGLALAEKFRAEGR